MVVKRGPQHIGSITRDITGNDKAFGFKLNQLIILKKEWPRIAGSVVAANVKIQTIRDNGVLVLSASTSVWMHEINCLRFQLLSKLNKLFSSFPINNIIVRMAKPTENNLKESDIEVPVLKKLTESENQHIEDCVKDVEDEDLQGLLRRIFIKSTGKRN